MDDNPRRILLIRPSALGDVCRSVPVLASLKRAYPEARIDWLVHEAFVDAVRHHPDLHEAIPFCRSRLRRGWALNRDGRAVFRELVRSLREPGYDLVVDAQGLGRSGFFARLTGAPRRIGFADARELGWLGLTYRVRVDPAIEHSVERMLALIEGAGIEPVQDMRLHTSPDDRAATLRLIGEEPYIVVAPTSRWAGKRWPDERFVEVVRALLDAGVQRVAIVASPSERDQCAGLIDLAASDERVVDLIGRTSVGEFMGVIERTDLVLANDSAALHMAVGFDRPIVALFGPTRIDRVGPYMRDADVLQAQTPSADVSHKDDHAGRQLMEMIETRDVIDACLTRLSIAQGASP